MTAPRTKESGIVNGYQLALLGRRVLALEAEREALREALVKLADYEGIVTPCDDRLCVECRTARVARAALERPE